MGCEDVINRKEKGYQFWTDEFHPGREGVAPPRQGHPASSSAATVDIVFEHPGRQTLGASVFVTAGAARSSPAPPPAAT